MCRSKGWWRAIAAVCCLTVLVGISSESSSASQQQNYRLVVVGDSLGDGIWIGLKRILRNDTQFSILRRSKVSTGFARPDFYDWNAALPNVLSESQPDMVVVIMGTNDQQPMRVESGRARVMSEKWLEVYVERANKFASVLAKRGVPTYWVGLPIMRSPDFAEGVVRLNDIFRDIAQRHGHTFIDTWNEFTDNDGQYSTYGPDLKGRTRKLRAGDGIHFTIRGYERFAKPVSDLILSDLSRKKTPLTAQSIPPIPPIPPVPPVLGHGGIAGASPSVSPPIPVMRPDRSALKLRGGLL